MDIYFTIQTPAGVLATVKGTIYKNGRVMVNSTDYDVILWIVNDTDGYAILSQDLLDQRVLVVKERDIMVKDYIYGGRFENTMC